MKNVIALLLILFFNKQVAQNNVTIVKRYDYNTECYNSIYNKHIANIKEFEGLVLTNYKCINNHKTIGYGCLSELKKITLKQADSLLILRYNQAIEYSKFHYKNFNSKQHLASGQLIFHLGIGTVLKYNFIDKTNNKMNFNLLLKYTYNKRMFINRLFIYNQFNNK